MRFRAEIRTVHSLAITALLMALAAILGYLEAVALPPLLPIPGLRVGLANIAVVVALALLGSRSALVVTLGKVLIVGLATGLIASPVAWMSLAGSLAAWGVMSLLWSRGVSFSVVGWSVGGAAAHVLAQLIVASAIMQSWTPFLLTPISIASSALAGLAIGFIAHLLLSRLPRTTLATVGF
jgi:heptaprenyl diphosphate synthase